METRPNSAVRPINLAPYVITYPTPELMAKAKMKQEVFAVSQSTHDTLDNLLDRHPLPKALCISAWIQQFLKNCNSIREFRTTGPISTEEIESQNLWWVKQAQHSALPNFQTHQLQLNLQLNSQQLLSILKTLNTMPSASFKDKYACILNSKISLSV